MTASQFLGVLAFAVPLFEVLGVILAVRAIRTARTSQGAIAWSVALVSMPVITVPLYCVFGRSKFHGYVEARRSDDAGLSHVVEQARPEVASHRMELGSQFGEARVLEQLAHLPFTTGNQTRLLVNGQATFDAIFAGLDEAQDYVLVQFYIVNDDELGQAFQERLIRRARDGIRVFFLYDEIGSNKISRRYLNKLAEAGVKVSGMRTTKGWRNRFQVNFRNHRKIVLIDGRTAFVGGHNVGDEYLGRHPKLTPWRDTHMRLDGPAVVGVQLAFLEDWHWATHELPELSWIPQAAHDGGKIVFVLPSGPADEYETCGLFFTHAINSARQRIWITAPYFVPDEAIVGALQLAAMRGVDVRVLIPGLSDNRLVKWAALTYVEQVTRSGVQVFEYHKGFMHQKVMLIDDNVSTVGTANFDVRSFRLNFEISVLVIDEGFAKEIEAMLEEDFVGARPLPADELASLSVVAQMRSRVARLFAPVL